MMMQRHQGNQSQSVSLIGAAGDYFNNGGGGLPITSDTALFGAGGAPIQQQSSDTIYRLQFENQNLFGQVQRL